MEYHTERYEPDLWYLSIGGDPKKFYTLSKVIRAELAVKHIRKGLQLSLPENRLAFAVIKQAVADLAHIKPNIQDSAWDYLQCPDALFLDAIELDAGYVRLVAKQYGLTK
jgi:hypothetical protein|tara:strand:- start:127 stop:456 length:330 start_codon:yes stop_codon:yes gene_type:complete